MYEKINVFYFFFLEKIAGTKRQITASRHACSTPIYLRLIQMMLSRQINSDENLIALALKNTVL